jgi:hypothetical protein
MQDNGKVTAGVLNQIMAGGSIEVFTDAQDAFLEVLAGQERTLTQTLAFVTDRWSSSA